MPDLSDKVSELLPCPFCGGMTQAVIDRTCDPKTPYNPADFAYPRVLCACGVEVAGTNWGEKRTAVAAWNRRTRPAASTMEGWRLDGASPSTRVRTAEYFIVAVRRHHNKKIYSFPATYLNQFPLFDEAEDCPEDGRPTTGWYTAASCDTGEFTETYSRFLEKGDELIGWTDVPQFAPIPPEVIK